MYQTTNLLSYDGVTILYQTPAVDTNHRAENLITNLENRSSVNKYEEAGTTIGWNARTGRDSTNSSGRADYYSCYYTNQQHIEADGYLMRIVIDLKISSFIHNITIVDDLNYFDNKPWNRLSPS